MKNAVLFAVVAVVVLAGCGGGGKAGAGNYKLKVSVNPANGGSISMDPNMESYNEWMDVKVTAAAAKGYIFDGWSGDATDKSKSVTIKMSGNRKKKLTANFKVLTPTFTDSRDGKTYKRVVIDEQVWMAENLNYEAEGSKCYENNSENCVRYGRLYNWSAAKSACPAGFHLPSDKEWTTLTDYVGGLATAGKKLKSKSGWNNSGDGTDDVEFSGLPGGFVLGKLGFFSVGEVGGWWSATEDNDDDDDAWYRGLSYEEESVDRDSDDKTYLFSVRCVQDANNTGSVQNAVPAQPNNTGTTQSAAPVQQNNTGSAQSNAPVEKADNKLAKFVPAGYEIIDEIKGDLNKDDLDDYVLMIAEKQNDQHRGIIIVFNNGGNYEKILENRNCFNYDKDKSGYTQDLITTINKGILRVRQCYRSGGGAIYGNDDFKFRYQNSDFEMIGYDYYVIRNLDDEINTISVNFLAKKMRTKNDEGEKWYEFTIKEPIKLRKVDTFDDFSVMDYISKK